MSVIIADSVGYEGTVDEPDWAALMSYAGGRQYGVIGEGDWKVTAGTADREVRIAPGNGFGGGVLDRTTDSASLTLPASPSGSRWHLIAARRDWGANQTSFDAIGGGTGTAQIPARNTTPGTADDHPIALVRVQAGQSQVVEIRDLRVWGGDGGAFAADQLVLQYLNRLGTRVVIGSQEWIRYSDALGNLAWASNDVRVASAPIALNQGLPSPLYKARAGSQAPTATSSGNRVFLDGAADVIGSTVWNGGQTYLLGYVAEGFRPATEVGGVVRFGTTWAIVAILPSGAIAFALPQNASANPGSLFFSLTGLSWPKA